MRRWERLAILAAVITQAGCGWFIPSWPTLPPQGTCRNFAMTTWGGGGPYDEIRWGTDIVHIDEPMLPMWGWRGDLGSAADVCGLPGLGMVRARVADLRTRHPGSLVWLNWSTDEIEAISRHCPGESWHQGADVFSFDSYGGVWDWEVKTRWMLDMFFAHATPEHRLGLVPEAFRWTEKPVDEIELVQIAHLYFDYAMRRDDGGMVFAVAPFLWKTYPGMEGMESMPQVERVWSALASEYPRCK